MKSKKPFKVGATYRLKKSCVDDLWWNCSMIEFFGRKSVIEFTPSYVGEDQKAWIYPNGDKSKQFCVATVSERLMFKRVDNR